MESLGALGDMDATLATARSKASANKLQALTQAGSEGDSKQAIEETAKKFEAVFISQMLKPMFETVERNEMFSGGHGGKMFRGMMVEEYGKKMAEAGGIGLAEHIKQELIDIQEAQSNRNKGSMSIGTSK
jgi:Rod binding domain-containing protein